MSESMQKAAVEYAVGREGQETTLASRVSPGMRPLAMESCQSLGFPICSMEPLLPASRTVRSQMAGVWSQGVGPARTQNVPLISSQTQLTVLSEATCSISCQDRPLTAFTYSLACLQ